MVARQDGARVRRGAEHVRDALGLDTAGQVQHVPEMKVRLVRIALQGPLRDATTEQGLFRGALSHLDVGVDRAVVVVQWIAGGVMLLRVANGDDRGGQRHVPAPGVRLGTRLRDERRQPASASVRPVAAKARPKERPSRIDIDSRGAKPEWRSGAHSRSIRFIGDTKRLTDSSKITHCASVRSVE